MNGSLTNVEKTDGLDGINPSRTKMNNATFVTSLKKTQQPLKTLL